MRHETLSHLSGCATRQLDIIDSDETLGGLIAVMVSPCYRFTFADTIITVRIIAIVTRAIEDLVFSVDVYWLIFIWLFLSLEPKTFALPYLRKFFFSKERLSVEIFIVFKIHLS